MGGYCYYTYTEDLGAEIHDCMWSGECYSCQANRTAIPVQTISTTAITVGKAVGFTTLTSTAAVSHPDYARTFARINARVVDSKPTKNANDHSTGGGNIIVSNAHHHNNINADTNNNYNESTPNIISRSSHSGNNVKTNKRSHNQRQTREHMIYNQQQHHQHQLLQHQYQQQRHQTSGSSVSSVSSSSSSSENKKLRHREVEKNRHRQLQAMVRTLSDNIPGKLDKETQVQTMKRAARYCIYLREVLNMLSNPSECPQGSSLRQKLDSLYARSCENVDLIMSSSAK